MDTRVQTCKLVSDRDRPIPTANWFNCATAQSDMMHVLALHLRHLPYNTQVYHTRIRVTHVYVFVSALQFAFLHLLPTHAHTLHLCVVWCVTHNEGRRYVGCSEALLFQGQTYVCAYIHENIRTFIQCIHNHVLILKVNVI